MSDAAEKAYDEALRRIETARETQADRLDLSSLPDLERLPPEIVDLRRLRHIDAHGTAIHDIAMLSELHRLQELDLRETKVDDLSPLTHLSDLRWIYLDNTPVFDLTPLTGLSHLTALGLSGTGVTNFTPMLQLPDLQHLFLASTNPRDFIPLSRIAGLRTLDLSNTTFSDPEILTSLVNLEWLSLRSTSIRDITPLHVLYELRHLELDGTQVTDLRPLLRLGKLGGEAHTSLSFARTPFAISSWTTLRLSLSSYHKMRTRETLAYLKTLPPWPEPLVPETAQDQIPQGQPAPLQVVEIDGVLRPFDPGDGLDDPGRALAREGWQTLRDYLADLAPILPRVDNHVPNLGRALTRLSAALGEAFDRGSPIAIGTHGQRVIRLARATGDSALPEDDVAELQEFAVALSLYLERFPEWRAYRDLAAETPANPETLRKTLPRIAEIEAALAERVGVDPTIPARLRDLRNLAQEDPQDPIAAAGLLDSFGNIMAALAHGLWHGIKATGKGLGWSVKTFAAKALETAAEKIAGAPFNPVVLTAADILLNKAAVLKSIAAAYPQKFVWLLHLLATLGL